MKDLCNILIFLFILFIGLVICAEEDTTCYQCGSHADQTQSACVKTLGSIEEKSCNFTAGFSCLTFVKHENCTSNSLVVRGCFTNGITLDGYEVKDSACTTSNCNNMVVDCDTKKSGSINLMYNSLTVLLTVTESNILTTS
ncbi:hypothetical protein SNEBB_006206 [Seison nebaliae]|nr:hypothetical protein SNEBB_006206 [Seison nebaliae]